MWRTTLAISLPHVSVTSSSLARPTSHMYPCLRVRVSGSLLLRSETEDCRRRPKWAPCKIVTEGPQIKVPQIITPCWLYLFWWLSIWNILRSEHQSDRSNEHYTSWASSSSSVHYCKYRFEVHLYLYLLLFCCCFFFLLIWSRFWVFLGFREDYLVPKLWLKDTGVVMKCPIEHPFYICCK